MKSPTRSKNNFSQFKKLKLQTSNLRLETTNWSTSLRREEVKSFLRNLIKLKKLSKRLKSLCTKTMRTLSRLPLASLHLRSKRVRKWPKLTRKKCLRSFTFYQDRNSANSWKLVSQLTLFGRIDIGPTGRGNAVSLLHTVSYWSSCFSRSGLFSSLLLSRSGLREYSHQSTVILWMRPMEPNWKPTLFSITLLSTTTLEWGQVDVSSATVSNSITKLVYQLLWLNKLALIMSRCAVSTSRTSSKQSHSRMAYRWPSQSSM